MEFFIGKNTTLPLLKLQVVKDGRSDYNDFMNYIESSTIYFSMKDEKSGANKIQLKQGGFVSKTFEDPNTPTEYYVYYRFSKKETNRVGRYEGQFLFKNDIGTLILPIREPLYINIIESSVPDNEPDINIITFNATYFQSSIGVTYFAEILYPVRSDVTVYFTNVLYSITGSNVTISTSVTIPANDKFATTTLTIDGNYDNLNGKSVFYDVRTTSEFSTIYNYLVGTNYEFLPNITPTPTKTLTPTPSITRTLTPTPSITRTLTPTPTLTEQVITDAIITNDNEYINVGGNLYLKFIDPL